MANVLIVYGTTEGHTRKIAERVGEWARARGHNSEVLDSANVPEEFVVAGYDAFIAAGSLHEGRHQRSLRHFVKEHVAVMNARPTAFLSVSMSAVNKDARHADEAKRCIDEFVEETGLKPTATQAVAGALKYTKYDFLKRYIMLQIVKKESGDIDTSQDYEYTDWADVESFVESFLKQLG